VAVNVSDAAASDDQSGEDSKSSSGEDAERKAAEAVDRGLIERWLAGDERAATALVERHAPALARFAASVGARGDVDELVQDTFVRAFGSLESFRGESSLRTWLFTIERRLLFDRKRAERRRPDRVTVNEDDAATEYTALDTMMANETEQRVQAAMAGLSPMQREIFILRVTEGMSYREIADVVGSTEGAARVHYHNAMHAVKERLND
jgi:RNA polymerase sigma-70 factor, ECF subfamily